MVKLEKEHKIFLFIGIPVWFLVGILLIDTGYPGILLDMLFFVSFYFIFLHGKKEHRTIYLLKIGLIMLAIDGTAFIYLNDNPSTWSDQFARNHNPGLLLTPNDEYVARLQEKFEAWIETRPSLNSSDWWLNPKYSSYLDDGDIKYGYYYSEYISFENITWSTLNELEKCMIIDWYIRNMIIEWTPDSEVYGVQEYKATPHEILQQNVDNGWTKRAKDDCDGEAVVTISLLLRYGFHAYIGDGKSHWFTVVDIQDTRIKEEYGITNVVLLNFWQTIHLWSYFDEDEFYIGQSPLFTGLDLLMMDDEEATFGDFYWIMYKYPWIVIPLIPIIAVIAVLFIGFPRDYKNENENVNREARRNKIYGRWPWTKKRFNPIAWIIRETYIKIGNPFRSVYINEWVNIFAGMIFISTPIIVLMFYQGALTQHAVIIFYLYIAIVLFVLDRDLINKSWWKIKTYFTHPSKNLKLE